MALKCRGPAFKSQYRQKKKKNQFVSQKDLPFLGKLEVWQASVAFLLSFPWLGFSTLYFIWILLIFFWWDLSLNWGLRTLQSRYVDSFLWGCMASSSQFINVPFPHAAMILRVTPVLTHSCYCQSPTASDQPLGKKGLYKRILCPSVSVLYYFPT
jgi:hypothetical protein